MIEISIREDYESLVDAELLRQTAEDTLKFVNHQEPVELTIAIEDDEMLRSLNFQFLEIDAPTDVLSFPSGEIDPETGQTYLGDIIISYPRALAQSEQAGHPVSAEIRLLVIHGVLHLLGYDHATPEEKQAMWSLQSQILQALAIDIKKLPED